VRIYLTSDRPLCCVQWCSQLLRVAVYWAGGWLAPGLPGSLFELLTCQASLEVTYPYHIIALLGVRLYFFVVWDKLDESSAGRIQRREAGESFCRSQSRRINPPNNAIRSGPNRIMSSFSVPSRLCLFFCLSFIVSFFTIYGRVEAITPFCVYFLNYYKERIAFTGRDLTSSKKSNK
jgi:hypothetical protein